MRFKSGLFEHFVFSSLIMYLAFKWTTPEETMSDWQMIAAPVAIAAVSCLLIEMYYDKVIALFKRR